METIKGVYELLLKIHVPQVWQKYYSPEGLKARGKNDQNVNDDKLYNYNIVPGKPGCAFSLRSQLKLACVSVFVCCE